MLKTEFEIKDIDEVAQDVLNKISSKIILFNGEMGTGKTTLIKSLIKVMGSEDEVGSPTFSLVNEYETDKGVAFHFDLYRIKDESELYDIGFEDYISREAWIFIEWPEIAMGFLPGKYNILSLKTINSKLRSLKLTQITNNI